MSKFLEATVISAKMQKTIVVRVDRKFRHPRYGKVITKQKKYKVHCEDTSVKSGDFIVIQETKPISKDKHFIFVKKIKAGTLASVTVLKDEPVAEKKEKPKKTEPVVEKAEAEIKETKPKEVKAAPKTAKKVTKKKGS